MFRRVTELEAALNCRDRGRVNAFPDDEGRVWIECCGRCHHVAHLVIMQNGRRAKACPCCLVPLDGDITGGPEPKYKGKNRIAKHMEDL